ncbi:alpha/beta hydrolase [Aliiroseovarius sp. 2305UL8-7]|uniref:COG3904 family protein n=1 Tax=Aliiroseovarius conchicola TaxID=3121637 RepID=UPI003528D18F
MKKFLIMLSICALSACEMIAVTALNMIETTEFQVQGTTLLMTGEINSKTLGQFEEIYRDNPQITTLVELEVPGSLDDDTMIALAYRVRELGLNTYLRADSEIHSGGVDLFLAGVRRTIEPGAVIGVHSWSDGSRDAYDYLRSAPEHEQNRRYIEDMLGSDEFYWFTIYAAPADGIHIMSEREILRFELATQ